jgi:hypothetical protein
MLLPPEHSVDHGVTNGSAVHAAVHQSILWIWQQRMAAQDSTFLEHSVDHNSSELAWRRDAQLLHQAF